MLVSKPASEERQMSAATVPEEGRTSGIGFPARVQVFVEVVNRPIAALRDPDCHRWYPVRRWWARRPVMSLPVAAGELLVSVTTSSRCGRHDDEVHDVRLAASGFTICTLRFPARATSVLLTGAEQELAVSQVVTRAVPPICSTEPGPGCEGAKSLPSRSP